MPEQERLANEEAEKRLKAALTAKKPLTGSSRVASPAIGGGADTPTDSKAVVQDTTPKEDVPMETEPPVPTPTPEVMSLCENIIEFLSLSEPLAAGISAFVRGCEKDSAP
jgi:THO complex subunit 2